MAARFAVVTEEKIAKIKEDSIPKKPKQATKYGLKLEVTIARKVLPHPQGIKEGSIRNLLIFLSRFAKTRCKAG